jgi:hypothetical protein
MKRDMDLVRKILLTAEDADGIPDYSGLEAEYGDRVLAYHRYLVYQAGLVDALVVDGEGLDPNDGGAPFCRINGLTWDGQEFLALAKTNKTWEWAKAKALEVAGGLSIDALKMAFKAAASGAMNVDGLGLG